MPDVLRPDYKLRRDLDRLTDANLDLRRVGQIVAMGETLLVSISGHGKSPLLTLRTGGQRFRSVGTLESVDALWPGDEEGALVQSDGAIWRVGPTGEPARLVDLPDGSRAVDASWSEGGVRIVALVDRNPRRDPDAPVLYPATRQEWELCRYTARDGWADLARVPSHSRRISGDRQMKRMVWLESVNTVPEEAQRAEVRGFDLDSRKVIEFTSGAGQALGVLMARDGSGFVYQANHQKKRPITTHCDLWWRPWGASTRRRRVTDGNRAIERFGWARDGEQLWMSVQDGLHLVTELVSLKGERQSLPGRPPASDIAWTGSGKAVFETESDTDYPSIWTGAKRLPVTQAETYDDLRIQTVKWKSFDGTSVEGVVYERKTTPGNAPLLIRAHGGPAGTVSAMRSDAVRAYRHLLRAGYRVFNPAFRGSMGFGDDFLSANIGCQGDKDLKDILTGIDHLAKLKKADPDRVGIFGGSYGGYMTLRALAVTKRFQAGVALYGFVSNRWMTLETGDYTYEEEYVAPLKWKSMETVTKSDVFPHLGAIDTPLLMLHGDIDPICTLSQSTVTYRTLEARGVPTGLVVYPGEGHGFRKPENQRDCARRTLGWFLKHLPVE